MKRTMVGLAWLFLVVATAVASDVGFVEDFSLAKDRVASLRQLIPGTEDYYYYHCLHHLNTGQYEKAVELTRPWLTRFGTTPRLTEIQVRHALLTYEKNPEASLAFLKHHLGLRFDHQRQLLGEAPNLPTRLDPKLIGRDTLKSFSFSHWRNLDNFELSALEWLAGENLDWERRRNLLQRLERPDIPGLAKLVVEDLTVPDNGIEFGTHGIHRQMTLTQLEDLLRLRPDLLNHSTFVQAWIIKLQPGADEDWRHDHNLTRAYLDRLLSFVMRLAPVHNPLKAHVLYHRLALDRAMGKFDRALFLEYLGLPRRQPYMAKRLLEGDEAQRFPADLGAQYQDITLLPPVGGDEPIVRDYLKHFLANLESPQAFEPYINDVYLRHLFAEVKIENGLGTPEQWANQLPPEHFRQLKERVDIDFDPTNKLSYAADETVKLQLHVKNVRSLLVKVFEINTRNYYREQQREVNTDINLDGLVATEEQAHSYDESPFRRVTRKFEFPQLNKPGIYVIDFIGGGKSSRALIRKGRLRPLVTVSTEGQLVTVLDEANRLVKDGILWLGGQEYRATPEGTILVPFSSTPGRKPVVLSRGDFACLEILDHQAEQYRLSAGIHVDRESLLPQRIATLILRPGLYLNGKPVSLKILESVRLRIVATDQDGIASSTEIPDFKLFEDRETVHEFRVPTRLAALQVTLQAKVKNLSQGKLLDLMDGQSFSLNGIDKTDKVEDLHLTRFGPHYIIELLGRTGEPKPDRAVQLALKHRDFKQPSQITLKTDTQGRVHLGLLDDITHVTATGPENTTHTWSLPQDQHSIRRLLHARAGDEITLPYVGVLGQATPTELALFELRGGLIYADKFDALKVRDSILEISGLAAGDYDLWLKLQNERIRIRVVEGPSESGYVLGKLRHMELPRLKPVHIASFTSDTESVTVRLRDASPFARVHIFATRYRPEFSAFNDLVKVRDAELAGVYPAHAESVYLIGRNIGDEYRYVLDRRAQKKFPGNMLERPTLLLNPWAVRTTESGEQAPAGGDEFAPRSEPAPGMSAPGVGSGSGEDFNRKEGKFTSNLDYLANSAAVVVNLVPDKDGLVKISRKTLGSHAMIQVVAVDPLSITSRTYAVSEQPTQNLDLRLKNGLDPKTHFTQQKQISVMDAGKPYTVADIVSSRFEAYDSLPHVYALYVTLTRDPKLVEFAFLLNWPKLKQEEKRIFYSKYACHELHFFLYRKDAEFFRTVVRPYLANKKDKTFLDHWLLESDLKEYLQPWQYNRLNAIERILLAQRIAGELPKTARHLNDQFRIQPPNPDRLHMLFETAVKGSELEMEDATGYLKNKELLKRLADTKPAAPVGGLDRGEAGGMGGGGGMPGKGTGGPGAVTNTPVPRPPLEKSDAQEQSKQAGEVDKERKSREGRSGGRTVRGGKDSASVVAFGVPGGDQKFYAETRGLRDVAQLYRKVEQTQEWAENNYFQLPIQQQVADLVKVNPFWLDYARQDGQRPFFSRHLAEASNNFTEIMFALAVLDLPFEAGKHGVTFDNGKMTFTPASPVIAFHEEVKGVAGAQANAPVLISQNFFRHGDRYMEVNGERQDKFISDEYVAHTVYGCHMVVTNTSSTRQKLSVLLQIPVGAIPLAGSQYTRTVMVDLEPYRTQTLEYLFYFPQSGTFAHFPVHVARNETLVASTTPVALRVVARPTKLDTASWEYVSQHGTTDQVVAYLQRENLHALNLELIAFRMKDRAFYATVLQLLQDRHVYQHTLWSYAMFHNDAAAGRQFLAHADNLVHEVGGPLDSALLKVDPVTRHLYEHLEYKPLVNARAHALSAKRQIVNARIHAQYHHFLKQLSYKAELSDEDWLTATYYLLLQDRIEEAQGAFAKVHPEKMATRIQYDYCAAYLQMFNDEPHRARAIAERYTQYPVDRWRKSFTAILHELDHIDGKGPKVVDKDDINQQPSQQAAREPSFEFTLEGKSINLTWQHLEVVRVNFYLMDVELLFSRSPFVQQSGSQFSAIRPNVSQEVKLSSDKKALAIPLPEALLRRNVMVEITAGGKTRSLPYYANAMNVRMNENYGQVQVTDNATGKPLSKVYVKTYVRLADGQIKFYKDGYTDHRGRFDYATVSTPERVPPQRFALLVLSEERGAQIREVAPPPQ